MCDSSAKVRCSCFLSSVLNASVDPMCLRKRNCIPEFNMQSCMTSPMLLQIHSNVRVCEGEHKPHRQGSVDMLKRVGKCIARGLKAGCLRVFVSNLLLHFGYPRLQPIPCLLFASHLSAPYCFVSKRRNRYYAHVWRRSHQDSTTKLCHALLVRVPPGTSSEVVTVTAESGIVMESGIKQGTQCPFLRSHQAFAGMTFIVSASVSRLSWLFVSRLTYANTDEPMGCQMCWLSLAGQTHCIHHQILPMCSIACTPVPSRDWQGSTLHIDLSGSGCHPFGIETKSGLECCTHT